MNKNSYIVFIFLITLQSGEKPSSLSIYPWTRFWKSLPYTITTYIFQSPSSWILICYIDQSLRKRDFLKLVQVKEGILKIDVLLFFF